jgi:hypothetical protein
MYVCTSYMLVILTINRGGLCQVFTTVYSVSARPCIENFVPASSGQVVCCVRQLVLGTQYCIGYAITLFNNDLSITAHKHCSLCLCYYVVRLYHYPYIMIRLCAVAHNHC